MRKLKLEVQVSIDGYTADVNGNTNWMVWNWSDDWKWDHELRQFHTDLTTSSDCILLSRKMAEEGFIHHWEKVAEDPANPQYAFAKPITEMRKMVFTRTLRQSIWKNTELAKGDFVKAINQLKAQKGKDIIVYGGPIFASSLIKAGLIDEFHFFINPTALGCGIPFFNELERQVNLELLSSKRYDCGVVVLTYLLKND